MKTPKADPSAQTDRLSALLRVSGGRPALDEERKARMREAVERDWRVAVKERRSRIRQWAVAGAVSLVLVVGLSIFLTMRGSPSVVVATTMRVTGPVLLLREDESSRSSLTPGRPLHSGDEITTEAGGRLLARVGEAILVRLDERSSVQIVSHEALRLTRGAIYVEVPEHRSMSQPLQLVTAFGNIQHVGTRFEIRVANDALILRVRDGIASFEGRSGVHRSVNKGQELLVNAGHVQVRRGPSAADDAWGWTHHISPLFDIEGRSVEETLTWLAHEWGFEILYADESVRIAARNIVLHGSIEGYGKQEALQTVLAGSDLQFRIDGERVYVLPGSGVGNAVLGGSR